MMRLLGILTASSMVAIVSAASADAASVINRDQHTYTMRIAEGDQEREITLAPNQQLEDICSSSCTVLLGDDPEPYEIAFADELAIQDGQLSLDENVPENAQEEADEEQQGGK